EVEVATVGESVGAGAAAVMNSGLVVHPEAARPWTPLTETTTWYLVDGCSPVSVTGDPATLAPSACVTLWPLTGVRTISSLVAAVSAVGRMKLTVAPVGVADSTVTLPGPANLRMTSDAPDNPTVVDDLEAALMATASTRGA